MQYQILVQSQPNHRFTAAVLGLPDCVVEGTTKDEAVTNAKLALQERLTNSEIITVEVNTPTGENPLLKHAGRFKDDETFDDVMAEIAAYRRQLDEEEAAK